MDINFHIPDFTVHFRLNAILVNTMNEFPHYYREGVRIASIFGNFHGTVWNGGRVFVGNTAPETIKNTIQYFNERNVPLRFTFTNPLINKQHLGDSMCNQLLRTANTGLNEVIVMSPVLEEYIRENYPSYPITSSTCKQIEDIDGLNEELRKDYKYVVLDYNLNNRFDLLEKIDPENRGRCEILINACCIPNCPRRGEHYRLIGQDQIDEWEYKKNPLNKKPFTPSHVFDCDSTSRTIYDIMKFPTYVSPEAIFEKYIPMGFTNFKIEGRSMPDIKLLETYIHYLVKPEYQNEVRMKMFQALAGKLFFTN